MTNIAVLGIDLGKNSCSVAGLDETGGVVLRRRVSRDGLAGLLAKLRPCTVAMEACCGAHHVGRSAEMQGHRVRLMPPEYVRPYVKAQKNDDRDAEAIAEAATRPTMRFVPLKEAAQLDVQALHRARERLVAERTALINQMRALLLERGIVPPQRWRSLAAWVDAPPAAGEPDPISPRIRLLVADMRAEWLELDRRIAVFDDEFAASARQDEAARRLATVPGIGPINATALVAAVGDASAFGRARDLAAWLGLVPKQATMQVNTIWLPALSTYTGLPREVVRARLIAQPCFNIAAAGAILRSYLDEARGELMPAIGFYHSHTPVLHQRYRDLVTAAASRLFGHAGKTAAR